MPAWNMIEGRIPNSAAAPASAAAVDGSACIMGAVDGGLLLF